MLGGHQDHRAPPTLVPSIQTPRIDRVGADVPGEITVDQQQVGAPSRADLWFLVAGIWLVIGHVVTGILLAVTVVGIPLALANFKLIPISLASLGKQIVNIGDLRQSTRY